MKDDKPDAWMPLYIGDWDGDTRHLDCEQDGAYGRLVRHYWRNGPLPDNDGQLSRIVGMPIARWRRVRAIIAAFFKVADGFWRHKRVDEELERWADKRRRYIERAAAGGRAKAAKSSATSKPKALLKGCTSASSTVEGANYVAPSHSGGDDLAERPKGSPAHRPWLGPQDFRTAVVERFGEGFAQTWLDQTGWQDVPERAIICRLKFTADHLRRDLKRLLTEHGIIVRTEQAA